MVQAPPISHRRRGSLILLALAGLLTWQIASRAQTPAGDPAYDVVIRHGRVLDGMGNPWVLADVAIKDGRFVKIGRVEGAGAQEIDAKGRYVSPGWIDMMDQSGAVLPRNGLAENKLRMGVTTAIGGEGGTPVPAERVAEYFSGLEKSGISINFGSYYSETQARTAVLGNTSRAPNAEELQKMQAILETAMRGGAMGMTTALIYPPSTFASTDELVEMAKVAGRYGGIYASHMRDEGKDLLKAIDEAVEIGERGGLPVEIFHLKAAWQPGWGTLMKAAGEKIDQARARGLDIAADMYLYTAGGTGLEATIPVWAQEGGRDALLNRLADPEIRARLKREIGIAGLVESRRGSWWMGRRRAIECPQSGQREISEQAAQPDRPGVEQGAGRRGVRSGRAGQRTRDGDLPHDERAGRRDGVAVSVDEHRQRLGRVGDRRRSGRDRTHAPARLWQLSAPDCTLRARAWRAHARAGDSQDDLMAGHPHAPRGPRRDPRRLLGGRRRLRLRRAAGSRQL
jgi:hypothetical protein